MLFQASTLDDLLFDVLKTLTEMPFAFSSTRSSTNGNFSEILGVLLHLDNPRARLSRTETKGTVFSCLGELLWYLSGSDKLDFIEYYISSYARESSDGKTLHGAYGPRLLNSQGRYNQIQNVITTLKEKPSSRRAVIQIFESRDLEVGKKYPEIPCTCTLQFFIRGELLHMVTHMRSNDAFLGLPHDIFAFTMLQEIIANALGVEIGCYKHSIGSLHLYESDKTKAEEYLKEGVQTTKKYMPVMPKCDPWDAITKMIDAELKIRNGGCLEKKQFSLDGYWLDLICLLEIFSLLKAKEKNIDKINQKKSEMLDRSYDTFIDKKIFAIQYKKENLNES